jgi:uncharacterized tellurite resistance protein B-like protein
MSNRMAANRDYQLGLLYLVHLLISADGVIDENETKALGQIRIEEKISEEVYQEFQEHIRTKKEREIYQEGIAMINECSEEEKLSAFVQLYRLSEVDGSVHVKEVRLLLYSIKMAGIEFNDVVERATQKKA